MRRERSGDNRRRPERSEDARRAQPVAAVRFEATLATKRHVGEECRVRDPDVGVGRSDTALGGGHVGAAFGQGRGQAGLDRGRAGLRIGDGDRKGRGRLADQHGDCMFAFGAVDLDRREFGFRARELRLLAASLDGLPKADWLLGDRGCDADWFRDALLEKGITPCIPGRKSRKKTVKYDKRRYKSRNRIEIMFGRIKDWRRVVTRYDRCPTVFLSAVALAATILL